MGAGRFLCVALPFGLTLASMVCILIAMLAGITDKNLDMFEVNTANLSISSSELANLVNLVTRDLDIRMPVSPGELITAAQAPNNLNITAKDLDLADKYKISVWNYCRVINANSTTTCTKGKFDWATSATNATTLENTASAVGGVNATLPKEVTTALKTFSTISKWTEVVYIIAVVTCALELVLGIFAIFSRAGSCLTFMISGFSTTSIIIASGLATAQSAVVVGTLDSVGKAYGVHASLNTGFLAVTWLAAAFSIGAGMFWMFTICCCAADHHKKRGSRNVDDHEKLVPTGAYQRVGDSHHFNEGQQSGVYNMPQYGAPTHSKPARGNAYEPYSHTSI